VELLFVVAVIYLIASALTKKNKATKRTVGKWKQMMEEAVGIPQVATSKPAPPPKKTSQAVAVPVAPKAAPLPDDAGWSVYEPSKQRQLAASAFAKKDSVQQPAAQKVGTQAKGIDLLPKFDAQGLVQAVVMQEVLTRHRSHRRRWW
jgi:hypothetical protein